MLAYVIQSQNNHQLTSMEFCTRPFYAYKYTHPHRHYREATIIKTIMPLLPGTAMQTMYILYMYMHWISKLTKSLKIHVHVLLASAADLKRHLYGKQCQKSTTKIRN